jgi:hypothetical protein
MLRAYLDPSVINRALDDNLSAPSLRVTLAAAGFEPATGLHTVLELARTFLSSGGSSALRAVNLFGLLRALEPAYQPEVPALLTAEVEKLRVGTAVLPFLSALDLAATRNEVARLAEGFFDDRARRFIEGKGNFKSESIEAQARHVSKVQSARNADPALRRLRTFQDVWAYFEGRGDIPRLVADVLHHRVSSLEASELAARLPSFPAINAATRANVYLNFIMLSNVAQPGSDKLDDYTHCIEASYCPAFISGDGRQLTALRHICPQVRPLLWSDVFCEGAV